MHSLIHPIMTFPLIGPGGEPIDLWRTIRSHGLAGLPPMRIDQQAKTFEVTLPLSGDRPRTARVAAGPPGYGIISVAGAPSSPSTSTKVLAGVRHVLRLDEDLSDFYRLAAGDPELAWVTVGAGRMIRSATVFEDVVKTVCTTNCAWSATQRMIGALVEHLGEPAVEAPANGATGRAFPTPAAMAEVGAAFYQEVVRAGYRGRYLWALARSVTGGELDLEAWGRAKREALPDDELAKRLLALPGVGPYAAAHIMMMLGRYSRPILDSWTRPTYVRLTGLAATDAEMTARFRRYGPYAGLAFWLYLTHNWVATPAEEQSPR